MLIPSSPNFWRNNVIQTCITLFYTNVTSGNRYKIKVRRERNSRRCRATERELVSQIVLILIVIVVEVLLSQSIDKVFRLVIPI